MPVSNKLCERALETGEKVRPMMKRLLREKQHKVVRVAAELGVYPNAVRNYLIGHDFKFDSSTREWIDLLENADEPQEAA